MRDWLALSGRRGPTSYRAGMFSRVTNILSYVALVISRLLALIIFPAQLPGDIMGFLDELSDAPIETIRQWNRQVVLQILTQLFTLQKLVLSDDPTLRQLLEARRRFLARGWSSCTVHTADGFELDAMLTEPPDDPSSVAPRFILFIGGNMQKYEGWLPYFDLYAREVR